MLTLLFLSAVRPIFVSIRVTEWWREEAVGFVYIAFWCLVFVVVCCSGETESVFESALHTVLWVTCFGIVWLFVAIKIQWISSGFICWYLQQPLQGASANMLVPLDNLLLFCFCCVLHQMLLLAISSGNYTEYPLASVKAQCLQYNHRGLGQDE